MIWLFASAQAASLSDLTTGDLLVTEVHPLPAATSVSRGQWFEIYNASGEEVDLDGLTISDGGSQTFTVSGALEIPAGGYALFATRSGSSINGGLPSVDYTYSTRDYSLPAGGKSVRLSFGLITFDSVSFGDSDFPDEYGASLSLDPVLTDASSNDDGASWCPAAISYGSGDYGSPGTANDPCPSDVSALSEGDIVVTEVMYDPAASAFHKGEWFEIYNASGAYLDLSGLEIDSGTGETLTIADEVLSRPGTYLLIAARNNPAVNGGLPTVDYRYIYGVDLILRSSDTLEVTAGATIIDTVTWNPTDYPGSSGISLQLNHNNTNDTDNDDSSSWCNASTAYGDGDYGSPAAANTDCDLDSDGDGYDETVDCDDDDASTYPGADELCDNIDNDCNGLIDDDPTDGQTFYADLDNDKFGDALNTTQACSRPTGYRTNSLDCDDLNASINPSAAETCDGIDSNCSGDESDASDASTWYPDDDSDGYGSSADDQRACSAPEGYVADSSDCNDSDGAINPDAIDVCDGTDNNCSGDESDAFLTQIFYADLDNDKFGDALNTTRACERPVGYRTNGLDCDDLDADINPSAAETCDGIDNNCSGDERDASDASTWYPDGDSDGYGSSADDQRACSAPEGYIADSSDCNDSNGAVNPDATETCDGIDSNCSGDEDDAIDGLTFYADLDNDKFGDALSTTQACERPLGYRTNDLDCDDLDADINPSAEDICNDSIDQDCDGQDYGTCDMTLADADGQISGSGEGDNLGAGVSVVDLNGDDVVDFALVSGNAETVYFFDGAADWSGQHSADDATAILTGAVGLSGDVYRSGGQDVNGDGYDDILVGSSTLDTNGTDAGGGYILYGPLSGDVDLTTDAEVTLLGDNAEDRAGRGLLSIGDVDGDGYDDLFATAIGDDTNGTSAGAAYLMFGPATGGDFSTVADAIYTSDSALDYLGTTAASVGDVDGDGSPDVMINAYREDRTLDGETMLNVGASYLLTSFSTGSQDIASAASATVYGAVAKEQAGSFIAGAGDLDGDGYDDILLGSQYADPDGRTDAGGLYLMHGPISGELSVSDAAASFQGVTAGDKAGRSADGLGDINGDGEGDIVIGAKMADLVGTDVGAAYILMGPFSGNISLDQADTILSGEAAGDRAGMSVTQIGDQNGGGQPDLLVGATMNSDGATEAGAAYLIFTERW